MSGSNGFCCWLMVSVCGDIVVCEEGVFEGAGVGVEFCASFFEISNVVINKPVVVVRAIALLVSIILLLLLPDYTKFPDFRLHSPSQPVQLQKRLFQHLPHFLATPPHDDFLQ